MRLENNKLNEILDCFGLSIRFDDEKVNFIDTETEQQMKSYVIYKKGYADQKIEYTDDRKLLLNGFPFYLEYGNKTFTLEILEKNKEFSVVEITKTVNKGKHLYEETLLKSETDTRVSYLLEEMTYIKFTREDGTEYFGGQAISDTTFRVSEIYGNRNGNILVKQDDKKAQLWFINNLNGEIVSDFRTEDFNRITLSEAKKIIDASPMFKGVLSILNPEISRWYDDNKKDRPKIAIKD